MDSLLAPPVGKIKVLKYRRELDNNYYSTRKSSITSKMQRARTPFGAVPISTIYGYDYPLKDSSALSTTRQAETSQYTNISENADYMLQTSRELSQSRDSGRLIDPYNLRSNVGSLSFLPSALETAHRMSRESTPVYYRDGSPTLSALRYSSLPPPLSVAESSQKTVSYSGTSPWNSTGFAYTPRYPQSYRGTASTSVPYARRYPARRFVPSYVPIRYSRRY